MANVILQGALVVTDLNGQQDRIGFATSTAYTKEYRQSYAIAAGATTVIFNTADTAVPVNPWVVLFLLPSINLDLSMGQDASALSANSAWNSVPLTASQPFVLFRNSFYYQYVNGAATNIFAGTSAGTTLKMSVKEPTGTTAGNLQLWMFA